jgi:hypothetical protein
MFHEYSFICGPLTKFLQMKLILRPAQLFEFDMPDLNVKIVHQSTIGLHC